MTICALLVVILTVLKGTWAEDPCDYKMSVNITDGTKRDDGSIFHNGILYSKSLQYKYKDTNGTAHLRGCPCGVKNCIRKCCPFGEAMYNNTCVPTDDPLVHPFNPPVFSGMRNLTDVKASEHFAFLFGTEHCISYVLDPYSETNEAADEDVFFLQKNGSLYTPYSYLEHQKFIIPDDFCIDVWLNAYEIDCYDSEEWTSRFLVLNCFDTEIILISKINIGMFISVPFLIVTFMVYAIVSELRNLHGKSLMCHVLGLTVSYIILIFLQMSSSHELVKGKSCTFIAFILYLSFMASFSWLNVMCFDIWWAFSNMRAHRSIRKASEKRRFIYYSLYAWGLPMLVTSFCALMHFLPDIPDYYVRPGFALNKCWFYNVYSELFYFYIPMVILVLANFVFFGITAYKIIVIKRETAVLQNSDSSCHLQLERNKQRANLNLKLFLVMGIYWLPYWISNFIEKKSPSFSAFWIISNFGSSFVGITIFASFVCKWKVMNLLLKRYHLIRYKLMATMTKRNFHDTTQTVPTIHPMTPQNNFILNAKKILKMHNPSS